MKVGKNLELIGKGKDFLEKTLIAQAQRTTMNKYDLMKLEIFYKATDTIILTKQQAT